MEAKAYKWDMSENKIKTIMAVAHTDLGVLKLSDVVKSVSLRFPPNKDNRCFLFC